MSDQLNIDSVLLCCRHGVSLYNVKTIIEHADLPPHVKSALREVSIHWWCGLRLGWGWGWRTNYYTICHAYLWSLGTTCISKDNFVVVSVRINKFWDYYYMKYHFNAPLVLVIKRFVAISVMRNFVSNDSEIKTPVFSVSSKISNILHVGLKVFFFVQKYSLSRLSLTNFETYRKSGLFLHVNLWHNIFALVA